jgi:hypothetical protein
MRAIRFVPLGLSAVLLAAHFLRSGNIALVVLCLTAPLVLVARTRWSVIVVQGLLIVAAGEWIRTALLIAQERTAAGAPVARMFVILGIVAAVTLLSALPLRTSAPRHA